MTIAELKHFGVIGMKWGKRKVTDDKPRVLAKGTEIHNISGGKREPWYMLYGSHLKQDNYQYRTQFAAQIKTRYGHGTIYDNVYVTKKDVLIASEKKSLDIFMSLYKADPKAMANSLTTIDQTLNFAKRMRGIKDVDINSDTMKKYLKMGKKRMASEAFQTFSKGLLISTPARTAFMGNLIRQGYDAIVDDNDKRSGFTKDPLIFINSYDSLQKIKETPLTKEHMDDAVKVYRLLGGT